MLLRPRTGLQDMTIELDPGTERTARSRRARRSRSPDRSRTSSPDQILATLDGDTRSFLQLLLQGGRPGARRARTQLSAGLRRFEPTARDLAKINGALAKRRQNIAA